MPATDDCLGVWELLENILVNLPSPDLTRVMRVCKTWKKIIEETSRLHNHRIILPLPPKRLQGEEKRDLLDRGIPKYPLEGARWRETASQLRSGRRVGRHRPRNSNHTLIPLPKATQIRRERVGDVSSLPRILLETYCAATVCTVYVRTGIRVKDLLDVSASLCKAEATCEGELYNLYGPGDDTTGRLRGCLLGSRLDADEH